MLPVCLALIYFSSLFKIKEEGEAVPHRAIAREAWGVFPARLRVIHETR